jgi:hypothetical protein
MATTPEKSRRRPGRPSRKEEMERALAEIGIDPDLIDPRRILASIAANRSMPPTARVAACKALLGVQDQDAAAEEDVSAGDINARAVAMMRRAN